MKEISQRIFYFLEQQKKKQKQLAQYVGIGESTLSEWKSKETNPQSEYIAKIAEFLGMSTDYLLTGKEFEQTAPTYSPLINKIIAGCLKLDDYQLGFVLAGIEGMIKNPEKIK